MVSASSRNQDVTLSPSLPPSPSTEEDLSRAHAWSEVHDPNDIGDDVQRSSSSKKGKRREMQPAELYVHDLQDTADESLQSHYAAAPADDEGEKEDEADTRRVQEVRCSVHLFF